MNSLEIAPPGYELLGVVNKTPEGLSQTITSLAQLAVFHNPDVGLSNTLVRLQAVPGDDEIQRQNTAQALGIKLTPEDLPWLGDQELGMIRWHIARSRLLQPVVAFGSLYLGSTSGPPPKLASAVGATLELHQGSSGEQRADVYCTLGASALAEVYRRYPTLEGSVVFEEGHEPDNNPKYSGSRLVAAVTQGITLVAGRPKPDDDLFQTAYYALHDNVFHLYSNILLRTPEVNQLFKEYGVTPNAGNLDNILAFADANIHSMAKHGWYKDIETGRHYSPYTELRSFLSKFLDPGNPDVQRLHREVELHEQRRDGIPVDIDKYRTLVNSPDCMLDKLDAAANSLPRRFRDVSL